MYFIKEDYPDIEATLRVTPCDTPKIVNAPEFTSHPCAENSYQNHLPKGIPLLHRF